MSDTPRTDEHSEYSWGGDVVRAEFARELERENQRLLFELRQIRAQQKNDYAGMREFQAKYIKVDSENTRLRALLREGNAPFPTQDAWLDWCKRIRTFLGDA